MSDTTLTKEHRFLPIHLWTDGTYVFVSVEVGGKWVEVIREFKDSPFSHIVESGGIEKRLQDAGYLK